MRKTAFYILLGGALSVSAIPGWSESVGLKKVCVAAPYDTTNNGAEHEIVNLVTELRAATETFPGMSSAFDDAAPEICLAKLGVGVQGYFTVEDNRIVINRGLSPGLTRAIILHELRHAQQSRAGNCPGPELSMQATARMTLALEADASAVSLAVAWKMRQAGHPDVWQAFAEWPRHSDIAAAFEAEMATSGQIEQATAVAFDQWYASEWRRETYYIASCSDYLDRQDRTKALTRYGSAPPDFLEPLCHLPDGRPYPCAEPGRESSSPRE